jgi:hypothetical protein
MVCFVEGQKKREREDKQQEGLEERQRCRNRVEKAKQEEADEKEEREMPRGKRRKEERKV